MEYEVRIRLLDYRGVGGGREGRSWLKRESLSCCDVVESVRDTFGVGK